MKLRRPRLNGNNISILALQDNKYEYDDGKCNFMTWCNEPENTIKLTWLSNKIKWVIIWETKYTENIKKQYTVELSYNDLSYNNVSTIAIEILSLVGSAMSYTSKTSFIAILKLGYNDYNQ
ncbi:hypothetical protein T4B_8938 [Trichinella pseudospiralis]|uniref:Uncharacterized protein n=1 Tax=Trichinella pseudospiralis TaxID=6337 RepID=A0A0V1IXQ0_TRIPS|nr:hypothetical protein T4B_8938 [Trichinella pseudospiralis]KRZ41345.1 hypothetical protein T4C_8063 [Trichinella pseudospiralis]